MPDILEQLAELRAHDRVLERFRAGGVSIVAATYGGVRGRRPQS